MRASLNRVRKLEAVTNCRRQPYVRRERPAPGEIVTQPYALVPTKSNSSKEWEARYRGKFQ